MSDQAVRCIGCKHFDLRGDPKMAVHLLGRCGVGKTWQYHPAGRAHECGKFHEAPEPTRAARRAWMAKQHHQQQHHGKTEDHDQPQRPDGR